MSFNLIFLGAPGSGKGTQAEKLIKSYGMVQISTGQLLRKEIQSCTPLGEKVKTLINNGKLVLDEIILTVVKNAILQDRSLNSGFILDGFPRTMTQARLLKNFLKTIPASIRHVFLFEVTIEQVIKRVLGRRICSKCEHVYHIEFVQPTVPNQCDSCGAKLVQREDDTLQNVKKRFQIYLDETIPLLSYYEKILVRINGGDSPENIFGGLVSSLKAFRDFD